jgi:RNA polymerase sigma-70 factor (ECF subfamily)
MSLLPPEPAPQAAAPGSAAQDPYRSLVEEIQAGREVERNFLLLYNLSYRPVYQAFLRWGFKAEECEDFTQETFIRVFKGIGSFRFGSRFATWLHEIAANIYRNELRRRAAAKRAGAGHQRSLDELLDGDGNADPKMLAALVSPLASAEEQFVQHAQVEELREALQQLPPQMQQCLLLRLDHGLKYREVAETMNISIETVKAHLHQAKSRLQSSLRDPAMLTGIDEAGANESGPEQ